MADSADTAAAPAPAAPEAAAAAAPAQNDGEEILNLNGADKSDRRDDRDRAGGRGGRGGRGRGRGGPRGGRGGFKNRSRTNEFEDLPETDDPVEIRNQVEFYFSTHNLITDEHLFRELDGPKNRPVAIKHIAEFKRMRRFQPYSAVVAALRESSDLVVVDDGAYSGPGNEAVKRKEPIAVPAKDEDAASPPTTADLFFRLQRASSNDLGRSAYVKGFAGAEAGQIALEQSPSEQGSARVGPHPSYIEVAKPYILQSRIQSCLASIQMSDAKEDSVRLQGVTWIDAVRRALSLPIRTFNTAVIYYHKFRLLHGDHEYNWADASAAALFTACKIEDTLKKSREILCASWNLKVGPGEALSSDDPRFDMHSKQIIGLERLMLESAGFDFRNRYPQKLMVKLARALEFDQNNEGKTAWDLSVDLYKTFAPLKQSSPTLAMACLELAARLHERDAEALVDRGACRYAKWGTSRGEVMETLLDLLDLYTHHRSATSIGPLYPLETFINIRITLNTEASRLSLPRFTLYASETPSTTTSPATPAAVNGLRARNGVDTTGLNTPNTPGTVSPGQPDTGVTGVRGQNGTVRFMLDAARARDERAEVDKYHRIEEEEYEVEVPNDRGEDSERERRRVR